MVSSDTQAVPFRTRFAPSPTGRMHAGNIFTALVTWILARRNNGEVLLRIEDIDTARSKPEYAQQIIKDFENLGLTWDDGPIYQHDSTKRYMQAFQILQEKAYVYPCFCSRADRLAASAPHAGEQSIYAGTCRLLTEEEVKTRTAELAQNNRQPCMRIEMPDTIVSFDDMFQGRVETNLATECGDSIIRRSDGGYAYQLAVAIDDADQGITHVVRGCDLVSSTPQQIFLFETLGYSAPQYAHVPLLVSGHDGHRLSKRHKDASLDVLLHTYGTHEAVLGHIAFVAGLIAHDEAVCAEELIQAADLEALMGRREIVTEW